MQVDLYLRWLLYFELFALFIVFVPFLTRLKKSLLQAIAPLFSKIQLVFWIFWSFVGFIFATTINDAYFSNTVTATMDATGICFLLCAYVIHLFCFTAKLEMARNERDALMSFLTLLLLPIIHFHGKSELNIYSKERSLEAMTKQAVNASNQLKALLIAQPDDRKKSNDNKKKKDGQEDDDETKMLRDQVSLSKARLEKANKKCKDLQSELEQAKEQLSQFETLEKVVKKKV